MLVVNCVYCNEIQPLYIILKIPVFCSHREKYFENNRNRNCGDLTQYISRRDMMKYSKNLIVEFF